MAQQYPESHPKARRKNGQSAKLQRFTIILPSRPGDGRLGIRCFAVISNPPISIFCQAPQEQPYRGGERASEKPPWWRGWPCVSFKGEVPAALREVKSYIVWIWAYCKAGASIKGDSKKTLQGVIDEVKAAVKRSFCH